MSCETKRRNNDRGCLRLVVWQKAIELLELVGKIAYVEAKIDFKLRARLADAAQSVSTNIAEGYGRRSVKEYIQYIYVALGSLAETMTRSIGLVRAGQISFDQFEAIDPLYYEVENRLLKLIEKLEEKHDEGDWMARIAEDPSEYLAVS